MASRIQTNDNGSNDLPWLPSTPRYGVVDNQQRPIPNLNPIAKIIANASVISTANRENSPSLTPLADASQSDPKDREQNDVLEVQLKVNRELMERVDAIEKENKAMAEVVKALRTETDMRRKQHTILKAKYDVSLAEIAQLKGKLATFKPVIKPSNIPADSNKENAYKNASN